MFKKTHSFNERYQGSLRLLQKYPDRIPIIVEKKYKKKNLKKLTKNKLLVPKELTIGQLVYIIKKKIDIKPEEAIFLFINNKLPVVTDRIIDTYSMNKDKDGYLYVTYFNENTFG